MPMRDERREAMPRRSFPVWRDGEPVPEAIRGAVAALGNFDGVHLGHQALVRAARQEAERLGRPAAVLTFEPHPRRYFTPDRPLFRLTPEPIKLEILEKLGLDGTFVRRFDAALAGTSASAFFEDFLLQELGLAGIVVGDEFRFGRGRQGSASFLSEACARRGLSCTVMGSVEESGESVSSSGIRRALEAGDVARANRLLGYRWFVRGLVQHGDKRGRTLGYSTANLRLDPDCSLRHGIYAVRVAVGAAKVCPGVASFGRRPTFDDGPPLLETHLFGFAEDLYGREIEVELVAWIRGEEKFESAQALVARMDEDSRTARARLAETDETVSFLG